MRCIGIVKSVNNADEMRIIMDLSSWVLFHIQWVHRLKSVLSNVKDKWRPFEGEITITFSRIIKHTNFKRIPFHGIESTATHAATDMFVQFIVHKNKSQIDSITYRIYIIDIVSPRCMRQYWLHTIWLSMCGSCKFSESCHWICK